MTKNDPLLWHLKDPEEAAAYLNAWLEDPEERTELPLYNIALATDKLKELDALLHDGNEIWRVQELLKALGLQLKVEVLK